MRFNPKIHKPKTEEDDPATRPVAGASVCMTSRPGNVLADVIGGVLQSLETDCTEDAIATIERSRENIRKESEHLTIGSGDAVALYPSCTANRSSKLVQQGL